ncbi:hypothetical protein [Streptomyces sp. SJL17-4]|uniref:hypothetical protein n=1 Tax=Streptomyces sp. SJL17-4 TaxID=2967224 RepID=UPI0030CD60F3
MPGPRLTIARAEVPGHAPLVAAEASVDVSYVVTRDLAAGRTSPRGRRKLTCPWRIVTVNAFYFPTPFRGPA